MNTLLLIPALTTKLYSTGSSRQPQMWQIEGRLFCCYFSYFRLHLHIKLGVSSGLQESWKVLARPCRNALQSKQQESLEQLAEVRHLSQQCRAQPLDGAVELRKETCDSIVLPTQFHPQGTTASCKNSSEAFSSSCWTSSGRSIWLILVGTDG